MKFIGPSPEGIGLLGDKTKARKIALKLDIPTPVGTTEAITSNEEAIATAAKIGYPVLLKAAAGGGGKGMRVVEDPDVLLQSLERAKGEALTAFGDDRVYVEKYIIKPRHIEIQILADEHGNVVYLGERECSIQRRHQKLIEEAPSPIMTPALRKQMGEAAVALVREAKYYGAGTVEFLVDQTGKFYFLEVNTRLQVEHPVTEFITGLDLVREQFRIAEGEKLSFKQSDIELRGHAIEVRIQAEDVWNDFMPSLGTISYVREAAGTFIRNDSALYAGLAVSGFYDSMLSKLIVWDLDRERAIRRMLRALRETRIVGVSTSIPFHLFALETPEFKRGDLSTAFVAERFTPDVHRSALEAEERCVEVAFGAVARELRRRKERTLFVSQAL
jgi:acetyl-CoA carboxylase biotin carboxylase subunit